MEAERSAVARCFSRCNPDRYFARKIRDICAMLNFTSRLAPVCQEYRSDDRDREILDNRVSLVQR